MSRSGFVMMHSQLRISVGQHSERGAKALNQDFHGVYLPDDSLLASKGFALAIADGISSSNVSHIASESAVTGFLDDYYATNDTWSVKTSAERVLESINAWLYAQTRQNRYDDNDQGYVCTFTGLVLKATRAHLFHIGDTRVYRFSLAESDRCEQLTEDHRVRINSTRSYLARALGIHHRLDIDYHNVPLTQGDILVLATDGIYEFTSIATYGERLLRPSSDLTQIARDLVTDALANGSDDNLTVQIVRIDELPELESSDIVRQLDTLPCPPPLAPGMTIDGLRIIHEMRISSRSHSFLAENSADGSRVVLKVPSTGMSDDRAYLERFLVEDWITRRVDSQHIAKACITDSPRSAIYVATGYIHGQSLAQRLRDQPRIDINTVRDIIRQVARGLLALHRLEILHQDLKPDNILITDQGQVTIIDLGAARVAGLDESETGIAQINLLGAAQYAAPEYFIGESGTPKSDLYSLAVITYQMLSGHFPYGDAVPKIRTIKALKKLQYTPLNRYDPTIPVWIDGAIRKAVNPDPHQRHGEISEFLHELSYPNQAYLNTKPLPLIKRNPLLFWQILSLALFILVIIQLASLVR